MKSLLILISVLAIAIAQRGDFAGRGSVGYPGLAARFRDDDTSTTANINNRFNNDQRIPIDARGDFDLVNRLNQWPRENRPFWILNADKIEAQRNPQAQSVSRF